MDPARKVRGRGDFSNILQSSLITDTVFRIILRIVFSELCKIVVNKVIYFLWFQGGPSTQSPPGSAPEWTESCNLIFNICFIYQCIYVSS